VRRVAGRGLAPPRHWRYLERYLRTGGARIIGIGRELAGRRRDGSVIRNSSQPPWLIPQSRGPKSSEYRDWPEQMGGITVAAW
jgi:hypothetical protein